MWRKTGGDSIARIESRRDAGGRFPSIMFISCVGPLFITHSNTARGIGPPKSQEEALGMVGIASWGQGSGNVTVGAPLEMQPLGRHGILTEMPGREASREHDQEKGCIETAPVGNQSFRLYSTPIIFLGLWEVCSVR